MLPYGVFIPNSRISQRCRGEAIQISPSPKPSTQAILSHSPTFLPHFLIHSHHSYHTFQTFPKYPIKLILFHSTLPHIYLYIRILLLTSLSILPIRYSPNPHFPLQNPYHFQITLRSTQHRIKSAFPNLQSRLNPHSHSTNS